MGQGIFIYLHGSLPIAPLPILEGLVSHPIQICQGQRLELKHPRSAHQGFVHLKKGILSGGPNQNHGAVFHPGQQRILLSFIKAMHLINKQNGSSPKLSPQILGLGDRVSNIFNPSQHCVQGNEVGTGGIGNNPREGRFTRPRRPIENERRQLISLDGPPQEPPWPHHRILPDKLVQGARPHPRS